MTTMRYARWWSAAAALAVLALIVVSCGGTGGGGGSKGSPDQQFVLNSSNSGQIILNVDPTTVDANKSDRLGLVATLSDRLGNPVQGALITFSSDVDDITFIPGEISVGGRNIGIAVTDANGNADVIAVAGSTPTGTGAIIGTAALFAEPPVAFGLLAQTQVVLLDIGFIDAAALAVVPSTLDLVEPALGAAAFLNIVGGRPPYILKNESSDIGVASLGQHCAPGCTENGGALCIGSPCLLDTDCGVGSPVGTCIGSVKRCLASCQGTNCGGSRCATDADCNDGSPTPANVCKDSGQSIVYTVNGNAGGTHVFIIEDSEGSAVNATVNVSFRCGNGVARGDEQCDLAGVNENVCTSFGLATPCTLDQVSQAHCTSLGIDPSTATRNVTCDECALNLSCEGTAISPSPVVTP
jgi:hypothetical protein